MIFSIINFPHSAGLAGVQVKSSPRINNPPPSFFLWNVRFHIFYFFGLKFFLQSFYFERGVLIDLSFIFLNVRFLFNVFEPAQPSGSFFTNKGLQNSSPTGKMNFLDGDHLEIDMDDVINAGNSPCYSDLDLFFRIQSLSFHGHFHARGEKKVRWNYICTSQPLQHEHGAVACRHLVPQS